MLAEQHSGGGKAAVPPHALALYQQQITMAHGESSQEGKQQQPLPGQLGKQQPYHPQADRDRDSPQIRSRSPSSSDKDGTGTTNATRRLPALFQSFPHRVFRLCPSCNSRWPSRLIRDVAQEERLVGAGE